MRNASPLVLSLILALTALFLAVRGKNPSETPGNAVAIQPR